VRLKGAVVLAMLISLVALQADQRTAPASDNIVLITLDGARTEEVFGGLDLDILRSTLKDGQPVEDTTAYARFWAPDPDARRRKLMPFFWSLVSQQGSIAGNPRTGSVVRLRNRHWFSYPGYAELLLGEPHDDEIKSNDRIQNPYPTVLEALRTHLGLRREQVATFASWVGFNEIVEHAKGATYVNAAIADYDGSGTDVVVVNQLQHEALAPWDGIRLDAFTFRQAMAHLESARPRVLYIAFDETDDWAHDGRYDRVLDAYARIDRYLEQLWTWVEGQAEYRGRTHFVITTDHGRGHTTADWRTHGANVEGAGEVWMAFVSPRMPQRGEWRGGPALSTSQVAATLASWMGMDWNADHPNAGRPIQ